MAQETVEQIWNRVRGEGNPEYAGVTSDFRAKLQSVYAEARRGGPESGIAGLEEFEREVRSSVRAEGRAPEVGAPSLRDAVAEQQAAPTPKGSGAQEGSEEEEKAKKDAAAVGASVEHDEVHSPSAPSAARPLAAEAPGSGANPLPEDVDEEGATDSSGESAEGEDLSSLTVAELRERARAAGATGYSGLSKDELVAAVEKAEGGLSALTVAELKDRAREAGVEGFSSMRKDDLITALEAADKKEGGE